jgi:hypothetical protein
MKKFNENLITRLISMTLWAFSFLILPALIGFSYLLKLKIEQAFDKFGRDETTKLMNIMGLFGLFTIVLEPRGRRKK